MDIRTCHTDINIDLGMLTIAVPCNLLTFITVVSMLDILTTSIDAKREAGLDTCRTYNYKLSSFELSARVDI